MTVVSLTSSYKMCSLLSANAKGTMIILILSQWPMFCQFSSFSKKCRILTKIRNDYDTLKPTVDRTILTEDRMTIK